MRTTSILIAVTLLAALLPLSQAGPDAEPERWIVGFHGAPQHERGDSYGGNPVVEVNQVLRFIVVETRNPNMLRGYAAENGARYVEYDDPAYAVLNFVPNDSLYGHAAHWGSKRIGGEAAWDVTRGSTAVKVAMVDSGLNKNHEEFAGQSRVLQGFDFANGDSTPEDTNSCNYHGTHTTSTAGSTTNNGKGIAGMSQHTILPVKIFAGGFFGCGTSTTAIVNALQYTGDQGAHLSSNSWGGGASSTAINDAIKYAHGKGVVHVASAGNSGPCSNCVGQPWLDNPSITIVVSSLTDGDTFSSFSSQGPQVDIIAPGEYIAGATSGTADYHAMSGTSMAAPHVTGALALHIAATGNTAYSTLESNLKNTAEDLGMSADRQGSGLVRADRLVAGGTSPPPAAQCDDGVDNDGDGLTDLADPGCTDASDNDETDPAPPPSGLTLSTSAYKVKGIQHVDLSWSGASSTNVDVYRNGAKITTTANDGAHTDNIGQKGSGSYTYKVCEAGTTTCSNDATATF